MVSERCGGRRGPITDFSSPPGPLNNGRTLVFCVARPGWPWAHVRERAAEDNGKGTWPQWLSGVGRTIDTGRSVKHPETASGKSKNYRCGHGLLVARCLISVNNCAEDGMDGRPPTMGYHNGASVGLMRELVSSEAGWGSGWSMVFVIDDR